MSTDRIGTITTIRSKNPDAPLRILVYGVEGVGKSTLGADAPSPVFLAAEDGLAQLDVAKFPDPKTWEDALAHITSLSVEPHDFKTLVVDTVDWLEPLLWQSLCLRGQCPSIEEYGGGYGKGYTAAVDEWRKFLSLLERARAKGMHIVLLAHSQRKTEKNPEGADYDRYKLKINERAAGVLKEWVDCTLFARHEAFAVKEGKKAAKGVSSGARIMSTQWNAAYDAKNRYSLPEKLPLNWTDLWNAIKGARPVSAIREEIESKLTELNDPELTKQVHEYIKNPANLAKANDRLNAKLEEKK